MPKPNCPASEAAAGRSDHHYTADRIVDVRWTGPRLATTIAIAKSNADAPQTAPARCLFRIYWFTRAGLSSGESRRAGGLPAYLLLRSHGRRPGAEARSAASTLDPAGRIGPVLAGQRLWGRAESVAERGG